MTCIDGLTKPQPRRPPTLVILAVGWIEAIPGEQGRLMLVQFSLAWNQFTDFHAQIRFPHKIPGPHRAQRMNSRVFAELRTPATDP